MRRLLVSAVLASAAVELASSEAIGKIELESSIHGSSVAQHNNHNSPAHGHHEGVHAGAHIPKAAFRFGKKHGGKHHHKKHHDAIPIEDEPVHPHETPIEVAQVHTKDTPHGVSAHACIWSSPSGHTYDLTAFSNHEQEFHLSGMTADGKGDSFKYRFSVCKSLKSVPPNCIQHHLPGSPSIDAVAGIQEDSFGNCYALGSTHQVSFHLHDPKNPQLGLDAIYSGGTPCSDGRPRELRIHFTCSQHHTVEIPPRFVVEQAEHCHYHVNWPSVHGCPLSGISSLLLHAKLGVLGTSGAHAFHVAAGPSQAPAAVSHATTAQTHPEEAHPAKAVAPVPATKASTPSAVVGSPFSTAVLLAKLQNMTVWDLLWLSSVLWYAGLFLYCFFGTAANVWRGTGEFGLDTIPHKSYWDGWLNLMIPVSFRKRVITTPIVSQLVAATGAVISLALKIVHYSIVGTRAVVKPTARFLGNRLPLSWHRTRGCLGAPSGDYPTNEDGKGPYAEKQKPVVRLRWEGGATDGHLVRRLAKGASGDAEEGDLQEQWYDQNGPVQTFAGDVKSAASEAASRDAARKKAAGGFRQEDFDAVRIGGLKMDAEAALAGGAAGGKKRRNGAGGDPAEPPPQHFGQDPDGHGPVFGQSVATADLLLIGGEGSTGISHAAGTVKGLPPAVHNNNAGGGKRK
jgi:hypothetical protein